MKINYYNQRTKKKVSADVTKLKVLSEPDLLLMIDSECHQEDGSITPSGELYKVVNIVSCQVEGIEGLSIACSYIHSEYFTLEFALIDDNAFATHKLVNYSEHLYLCNLLKTEPKYLPDYISALNRDEIMNQIEFPEK